MKVIWHSYAELMSWAVTQLDKAHTFLSQKLFTMRSLLGGLVV